jgi:hypothetical protein
MEAVCFSETLMSTYSPHCVITQNNTVNNRVILVVKLSWASWIQPLHLLPVFLGTILILSWHVLLQSSFFLQIFQQKYCMRFLSLHVISLMCQTSWFHRHNNVWGFLYVLLWNSLEGGKELTMNLRPYHVSFYMYYYILMTWRQKLCLIVYYSEIIIVPFQGLLVVTWSAFS